MADAEPNAVEVPLAVRTSDLPKRTATALIMVAIAGTALWLGGLWWNLFVALIAVGVLWEWRSLVVRFEPSPMNRGLWNVAGILYIGIAALLLACLRNASGGSQSYVLVMVGAVIATDVGAYFSGRTLGGPKIAPTISPSKTWAGLAGGIAGSAIVCVWAVTSLWAGEDGASVKAILAAVLNGTLIAIIAQAGDFFESWMKRRAMVKDSGKLLPGHGGLFDRVDGLLAVAFMATFIILPDLLAVPA